MKFIVNRVRGKNLNHEFNADNLASILTIFWQQGLDADGPLSMTQEEMQKTLDSIFEANKGSESFRHDKLINGLPMGLSFKGTWVDGKFQVESVTLSKKYTNKIKTIYSGVNKKTARDVVAAFNKAKDLENLNQDDLEFNDMSIEQNSFDDNSKPKEAKSSFLAKIKNLRLPMPNFSSMLGQVKWPSLSAASVALAARTVGAGRLLFLGLGSMTLPLVTGVSFVASFAAQYLREAFKRSSHKQVLAPQDANESVIDKLAAMDEATWQSVKHGFEAQKGFLNQFKACARPSDWLHPKAYYAGYRQAEINPDLDVNTIDASRKEKLKSA